MKRRLLFIVFAVGLVACQKVPQQERVWTGPHPFGKARLYFPQRLDGRESVSFGLSGIRDEIRVGDLALVAVAIDDQWTEASSSSGAVIRIPQGSSLVVLPGGAFRTLQKGEDIKGIPLK